LSGSWVFSAWVLLVFKINALISKLVSDCLGKASNVPISENRLLHLDFWDRLVNLLVAFVVSKLFAEIVDYLLLLSDLSLELSDGLEVHWV